MCRLMSVFINKLINYVLSDIEYKLTNYVSSRCGGRVVSASVSGSGGPGSDPGGVTWLK